MINTFVTLTFCSVNYFREMCTEFINVGYDYGTHSFVITYAICRLCLLLQMEMLGRVLFRGQGGQSMKPTIRSSLVPRSRCTSASLHTGRWFVSCGPRHRRGENEDSSAMHFDFFCLKKHVTSRNDDWLHRLHIKWHFFLTFDSTLLKGWIAQSLKSLATCWTTGVQFPARAGIFLLTASRSALRPTRHPIQCIQLAPGALSTG
jgi:hypothetical protein